MCNIMLFVLGTSNMWNTGTTLEEKNKSAKDAHIVDKSAVQAALHARKWVGL